MAKKFTTLLLVVLIVGFMGTFGYAQDTAVQTKESDQKAMKDDAGDSKRTLPAGLAGLALVDKDVRSSDGETIGTVENVIIGEKADSIYVVVAFGGFLGMGEEKVAVPFDKIKNTGQDYVLFTGTQEELEKFDRIDRDWWNPYGRRARYERRYHGPGAPFWADPYHRGYYRDYPRGADYYDPYYDGSYHGRRGMMRHPGYFTEEQRQEMQDRRARMEARRKQFLESEKNYWADLKKKGDPYAKIRTGQSCADQSIRVSEVLGATVRNRQGDILGEIDDLIMGGREGFYAIIGVGGFLGVGEHMISVPVDSLEFAADEGFIYDATKEELNRHPSFNYEEATSCGLLAPPRNKDDAKQDASKDVKKDTKKSN